jgi:hypothetical protein
MKKYWILSAAVIVVIGTTLLLVLNKDNKEKAGGPAQIASSGGEIQAALAANKQIKNTEKMKKSSRILRENLILNGIR